MIYFPELKECRHCHKDGRRVSKKDVSGEEGESLGLLWCNGTGSPAAPTKSQKESALHSSIPSCLRRDITAAGGALYPSDCENHLIIMTCVVNADCKDELSGPGSYNCPIWVDEGHCDDKRHEKEMKRLCPCSCNAGARWRKAYAMWQPLLCPG